MDALASGWAAFQRADVESGNLLGIGVLGAIALLAVLAIPPGARVWPRLWTCGTVGALAILVLFAPR